MSSLLVKRREERLKRQGESVCLWKFVRLAKKKKAPSVLELGAKRSNPEVCTLHKEWIPHHGEYKGLDFEAGQDVDILADIHNMSDIVGRERFDIVISCSTFEHIQYPWIAVVEICRVLKLGGLVFVQTHQTFPVHAYPRDYWRFTCEALETLFCPQVGFRVIGRDEMFECRVRSPRDPEIGKLPAYLNVHLTA